MERSLQRLLQVSIDLRNQMAEIDKLRAAIQSAEASKQYQVRKSPMRLPAVSATAGMMSDGEADMAPDAMACKVVMIASNFVSPQTLSDRKTTAVTDRDEITSADQDRLRILEELMNAGGYARSRHGFWITPGVEMKTRTSSMLKPCESDNAPAPWPSQSPGVVSHYGR
jgi:hypothetical protein